MRHVLALALFGSLALSSPLPAADGAPPAAPAADYLTAVKPVLAERCFSCHGAVQQKAGLRLDAGPLILKGSDNGPVVAPGKPDESLLIDAVTGAHDAKRMPKEGAPLTAEQVAALRTWVEQGAKVPPEPTPPGPEDHWAFKPPVRPAVPAPSDEGNARWVRNPIDAFLAAEYEKRGLKHAPEADRATLLRRVYLDLTGLPPDRRQVEAFALDPSPEAYEKVVDALLASPRYGERWGRHWLDVWRYSDWAGYVAEVRDSQPFVWRWREWVVESLNADVPYDRMVTDMLAADEAEPADASALRATGYLARDYYKFNRNVWMDAAVEHTAKAFLGLTLNCAKCHDHKYDPVGQKEYYRFRAIFEPYDVRTDRVPGEPDVKKDGLTRVFDKDAARPTYLFVRGNDKDPVTDAPLPPGVPAALGGTFDVRPVQLPSAAYYPGLSPFSREEALAAARAQVEKSRAAMAAAESAPAARREAGGRPPESPEPFLVDDFSSARPEVWVTGPGRWEYRGGRLVQSQTGSAERGLVSRADHPHDFTARFRFVITGGEQWKSVGVSFDCDGPEPKEAASAYLSAHGGGKAQVYFRRAGSPTYPAEATVPVAVAPGREQTLRVDVRGQLVNVYADDVLVIAYRLPAPRRPGKFGVWTFDASAEFLSVRVEPLASDVKLVQPGAATAAAAPANPARARARLAADEAALAAVDARLAADAARYGQPRPTDADDLAAAAALAERRAAVAAAEEAVLLAEQKADAKAVAAKRKALEEARAAVEKPASTYAPFGEVYPAASTGRRLALARWITGRRNPLAARVAVNHIWMRHFGEPLVPTVFDFGLNGKPPTHPELLDWLAVELMEPTAPSAGSGQAASGPGARPWSMKSLHRLIVTSAAYRMASSAPAGARNESIDPDNRFLWRMNARRVEAEAVRDSLLSVAGKLDLKAGGPDLDPSAGMTSFRRSVWFRTANEKQMTFLQVFDAPSPTECYRRQQSVVPQQALALANSPLSLAMARSLAADLSKEVGPVNDRATDAAFVAAAFGQVLGREPTAAEREACGRFLIEQTERLKDPAKLTPFSGDGGASRPAADPRQRAREGLVHVLLNHNDFVTSR